MKKNSVKNTRINSEVRRELADIIRSSKDPRIHQMTSVMLCEVATDLKTCKAYISVMGSDEDRNRTYEGLSSASGYIRRELARRLNLRNTPEITFIMDTSIEDGIRMMKLIDEVNAQTDGAGTDAGEANALAGEAKDHEDDMNARADEVRIDED